MKNLVSLIFLIFIFSSCQQASMPQSESIWKPYSRQAIEDSVAQKKPVVIDFSAEWCPVCHELDQTLFSLPEIKAKLARVTALRMDATNQDDPNVQKILEQYSIEGLPTIVLLNSSGEEINNSRVIGFVTPEEFSQVLALLNIFK
jgi:thiol:disulfide interchange protein DsbD